MKANLIKGLKESENKFGTEIVLKYADSYFKKKEDYIKMVTSYLEDFKNSNDVQDLKYARGWIDALERNIYLK